MPYIEHRVGQAVTEQELERRLLTMTQGIIYLEGPTLCGKSTLLRRVQAGCRAVRCLTAEELMDVILESARRRLSLDRMLASFDEDVLCLEDVDMLMGRATSLEMLAEAVDSLSRRIPVVITGIRLVGVLYLTPDAYYCYKE